MALIFSKVIIEESLDLSTSGIFSFTNGIVFSIKFNQNGGGKMNKRVRSFILHILFPYSKYKSE